MRRRAEAVSKRCTGCGQVKPLSEFYKRRDGKTPRCKACLRKEHAARYAARAPLKPKRVELAERIDRLEARVQRLEGRFLTQHGKC